MLSLKAVYDGKDLIFIDRVKINTPHEVIVTFLDEPEEDITALTVQQMAMAGGSFDFLNEKEEDIYSDDDLKVKYK